MPRKERFNLGKKGLRSDDAPEPKYNPVFDKRKKGKKIIRNGLPKFRGSYGTINRR